MIDKDEKAEMPVHLVIAMNEYTRIKTETPPRIGRPGKAHSKKDQVWLDDNVTWGGNRRERDVPYADVQRRLRESLSPRRSWFTRFPDR
jgi:hypothetical protein